MTETLPIINGKRQIVFSSPKKPQPQTLRPELVKNKKRMDAAQAMREAKKLEKEFDY